MDRLIIIDFDKAEPPFERYKTGEMNGIPIMSRFMPVDFNAREWVASIERKHYQKLPYIIRYWFEKEHTLLRDEDVWYLADAYKDKSTNPMPGVHLDWYRTVRRGGVVFYVVAYLNRPRRGYKTCEIVTSLILDDRPLSSLRPTQSDNLKYRLPRWTRNYLSF